MHALAERGEVAEEWRRGFRRWRAGGVVVAGDLLVVGRQVLGHLEGDNVALGQVSPQRLRQVRLRRARPPAVGVRGGAAARWRVRLRSGMGQGGRAGRAA